MGVSTGPSGRSLPVAVGLLALDPLILSGCTPKPPGYVAVGRDGRGTLVGTMVSCSDPPHRALLQPSTELAKSAAARTGAEWQFERSRVAQGQLVTWALLGQTDTPSVRSLRTVVAIPEGEVSLYVQRDPQNGASGIDFKKSELEGLKSNEFLYRGSNGALRRGTQADVLAAASC